jgi:hypothetical protein
MEFLWQDFNGAETYFGGAGKKQWAEIAEIVAAMPLHLQASDQARRVGSPIFDPKGTNAHLTDTAKVRGWESVPVPKQLTVFGVDWDAGKSGCLAEWQFSNYPFLWNNVIRTEAVFKSKTDLPVVGVTNALIVVTKSGIFPASNSTLYFEQAAAQLDVVIKLQAFTVPIRLVGLTLTKDCKSTGAVWTKYGGRYHRDGERTDRTFSVSWKKPTAKYGLPTVSLVPE